MTHIIARGPAEIMAFESRIMHGNHNNAMLIDRAVDSALYALSLLQSQMALQIADATAVKP